MACVFISLSAAGFQAIWMAFSTLYQSSVSGARALRNLYADVEPASPSSATKDAMSLLAQARGYGDVARAQNGKGDESVGVGLS